MTSKEKWERVSALAAVASFLISFLALCVSTIGTMTTNKIATEALKTLPSGEHTLTNGRVSGRQFFRRRVNAVNYAISGCQRCGNNSPIRLFGCVGRRVSTSLR